MESWESNYDAWKLATPEDDIDEEPVFQCDCCDRDIYEDEYYYEVSGKIVCESCIDNFRKRARG